MIKQIILLLAFLGCLFQVSETAGGYRRWQEIQRLEQRLSDLYNNNYYNDDKDDLYNRINNYDKENILNFINSNSNGIKGQQRQDELTGSDLGRDYLDANCEAGCQKFSNDNILKADCIQNCKLQEAMLQCVPNCRTWLNEEYLLSGPAQLEMCQTLCENRYPHLQALRTGNKKAVRIGQAEIRA